MTHNKKLPVTEEVVLNIFDDIFNINTMDELLKIRFSKSDLIENNAVKKWKTARISEELRKYISPTYCKALSVKKDDELNEQKIITVLRAVLKRLGYKLYLSVNTHGDQRYYLIEKS